MSEYCMAEQAAGRRPASDEQQYVRSQYRSQDNLAVRIRTHEMYSELDIDFATWVLDSIQWEGDETVVDVGCGAGFYSGATRKRAARYVAGDLSLGMLRNLQQDGGPRINLNAQRLPLRDAAADVILANHMLYHVPDIDGALAEFRRVLRPGGQLLAATNSEQNMAELEALQRDVMGRLDVPVTRQFGVNLTFTLENGEAFLRRHFNRVERRVLYDALVFPDAQPVIDYLGSSFERYEGLLPTGMRWKDVSEALQSILESKIRRHGEYRVNKLSGVFVAWNS